MASEVAVVISAHIQLFISQSREHMSMYLMRSYNLTTSHLPDVDLPYNATSLLPADRMLNENILETFLVAGKQKINNYELTAILDFREGLNLDPLTSTEI